MSGTCPQELHDWVVAAAETLDRRFGDAPRLGFVLGSGLGAFTRLLADAVEVPYEQISHFPISTVAGHAGTLVVGQVEGVRVCVMSGRVHYYEGYPMWLVTLPVRALVSWGTGCFVVTNASGGLNPDFRPGAFMCIRDHVNLMGVNPLVGLNDPRLGPRFPDMSEPYDDELCGLLHHAADKLGTHLLDGIYAGMCGPSYETPAEVHMLQKLGVDAVGMSTVPEVIVLNHMGARAAAVTCVANLAAGIAGAPLSHQEVKEVASRSADEFAQLLRGFVGVWRDNDEG